MASSGEFKVQTSVNKKVIFNDKSVSQLEDIPETLHADEELKAHAPQQKQVKGNQQSDKSFVRANSKSPALNEDLAQDLKSNLASRTKIQSNSLLPTAQVAS